MTRTLTDGNKALKAIKENRDFCLKTKEGFIYCVGGMLCKTIGQQPYVYDRELKGWKELWTQLNKR